ncbi:hypothetical protein U9M48_020058 [Paspalum notatum var. saurae]|uniref:Uncharacterized protein n=1 Tax=Paspalum notatum var. saurae TaxID=547442 RepID=A0AAQ3WRA9_PASNO
MGSDLYRRSNAAGLDLLKVKEISYNYICVDKLKVMKVNDQKVRLYGEDKKPRLLLENRIKGGVCNQFQRKLRAALCSEVSPAGRLLRCHRSSHNSEAVSGYCQVASLLVPRSIASATGHQQRPSSHTHQQQGVIYEVLPIGYRQCCSLVSCHRRADGCVPTFSAYDPR